jgi:N-acyl-D-aspartate/D-glutamate deacylase
MVTPGFVDIHTHLDAQIGWDPLLTPVSWHGVTTALLGNCGVTFAPCRKSDRNLLAGMMETVEDIPREAILSGLPWDWEDYGGYLDALTRLEPAINVAGMVGHCAVRYYVMGERAVEEAATEAEKDRMAEVVAQSIDSGAVGFSTNRYEPHKLPDGRSIPGTFAEPDELIRIAREVGARNGLMQAVGAPLELLTQIAETSKARVLFSTGVGDDPEAGRRVGKAIEDACAGGLDLTGISQVRGSGYLFGLQSNLPVKGDAWEALRKLEFSARLEAIRDAATREKLVAEARAPGACGIPMNQVYFTGGGETPVYTPPVEENLAAIAGSRGEHWSETFLRLMLENEGRGFFNFQMFNRNLEALGELFTSERVFPSLGDAGAHVSQIMDAGWSSFILSYWVREKGLYSMGEGIRRMTSAPARIIGLKDRGILAPGMRADVNVFDAARVAELQPELVHDFPGGAPRYIQRARGYKTTIVNGRISIVDGEHTDARSGAVLRHTN